SEDESHEPERPGLGPSVRRLGWVEHESFPVIFSLAEALMLPSPFEPVGLHVLEAMPPGCPVLPANLCGQKDLAAGPAGLVDPDSVGSIASGLERLLRDAEERARLIAAGRERAAQFTWSLTERKVLDVLENIAQV